MGSKLKVAGWLALGAVAGALTTMQFQAIARSSVSQLPLEELQQLAAVFGMVKTDYVEPVDEKPERTGGERNFDFSRRRI